ncbi:MAG: hypothetical protein K2J74_08475 [Muribaculaceae bacterium]|nr:hypothetical protein [Muribaculaceae bacterium]
MMVGLGGLPPSVWLRQPRAKSDATLCPRLLTLATSVDDLLSANSRPYHCDEL